MNLQDWLTTIEFYHPNEIELGLDRINRVASRAGLNTLNCPVVTVAGTNGKGSTSTTLARLLENANLRVGLYTSPHLLKFNERIRLQGKFVQDEVLCQAFSIINNIKKEVPLTFFEFTTLAALYLFKSVALDIVILEVGLGGRLDAVNIVDPTLAIITSLGLDHQEYLGETIEKIATEKAGILRKNIPVILSQNACAPTLLQIAEKKQNKLYVENKDFIHAGKNLEGEYQWDYQGNSIQLSQVLYPFSSVSLAMMAYTVLKQCFDLPHLSKVASCLTNSVMPGRFQRINTITTQVILDVAHNPPASEWLAKRIQSNLTKQGKLIAVWSSLKDKALTQIVFPLKDFVSTWHIAELKSTRAASIMNLQQALKNCDIHDLREFSSISVAYREALQNAGPDDIILVYGSFYTVAEVMNCIQLPNRGIE